METYTENICGECGFMKKCSDDEFMVHMSLHDEMDEMFEELGIVQEQMQFKVTITPPE